MVQETEIAQIDNEVEEFGETQKIKFPKERFLGMILGMLFIFVYLSLFGSLFEGSKKYRNRADSPIPPSLYNRLVWVKTEYMIRQVPFYAAVKIRQRIIPCDISTARPRGYWWYRIKGGKK